MTNTKVAIANVDSYDRKAVHTAIEQQLSLLGGLDNFVSKGDSVLLKPNFIMPHPAELAVQTHPAVIEAMAKILLDFGAKPFVADSPAWSTAQACAQAMGLDKTLKHLNVPIKQLDKPKKIKLAGSKISISSIALEADAIINIPKLKAHQQLAATFAVKNMFGCVCGKEKSFWHFAKGKSEQDFCEMLIEIYKLLTPKLNIIDGIIAMQGQGPINGTPRPLRFLIAGTDPIACELTCCKLINFDPQKLPIIQTAKKINFGQSDIEKIQIVGDPYKNKICKDFLPATPTPLQFTLPRVCKSIAKQILHITKSRLTKKNQTY